MKKLLLTLVLGLSTICGWGYETIPTDASVKMGTLPNGLTYYVKHNDYPEHHADFFIAQRVGSIQEEESQRGLAHFLEHMCFNGTKHFPGNNIITYMESIGVKFGANLNAYTSTDETVYNICNVPTARQSSLDSCFLVLSDWSHELLLKDKDIDEERGVIEGEWRMRTTAYNRMLEKAAPILYPGSLYGERMPIGLMSVVKNFKYKALRDYYKKWYHPSNQAIIVVGDIDTDYAVNKIKELFGNIKNPKNSAPVVSVSVPDNGEIISTVQSDKEQSATQIRVMLKHDDIDAADMNNTKFMENDFLKSVITSMLNYRFEDLELDSNAPFTHVGIADRDYLISKTKQALQIIALSKNGKGNDCVEWISREIKRVHQYGFTETEYKRAALKFGAALEKLYREKDKYTNTQYARDFVRAYIDGECVSSIDDYYHLMNKVIKGISLEQVNRFFNDTYSSTEKNVVLTAFCPEKPNVILPTDNTLADSYRKGLNDEVTAYVDSVRSNQLLPYQPTPGKIVSETNVPEFDAKLLTLSNGVKVYLKKTNFNDNEIVIAGTASGGLSQSYKPENAPSYKVINAVMGVSGYGQFSSNELKKALVGKDVKLSTFVSKTEEGFQGSTTPKDMETEFQLLYLKLTSPQYDEKAFNTYIENYRTRLDNQNADPKFEFADSIFSNVFAGHPLGAEKLSKSEVDKVDYKTVMQLYKERFSDFNDFKLYIVGNFDEDSLKTMLVKYVASLPSNGRVEHAKDINYRLFKGEKINRFTRAMENPQDKVYFFWTGNADFNPKNSLVGKIAGQIMNKIFLKEIREIRGWTYHVDSHCSVVADHNGNDGPIIYFPLNVTVTAGKAEETRKLVESLMNNVAEKGISDDQLQSVKEYYKKVYGEDSVENTYWMVIMKNFAKYGMDFNKDYLEILNSITKQDIQKFIKDMLAQGNRLELIMTATK